MGKDISGWMLMANQGLAGSETLGVPVRENTIRKGQETFCRKLGKFSKSLYTSKQVHSAAYKGVVHVVNTPRNDRARSHSMSDFQGQ